MDLCDCSLLLCGVLPCLSPVTLLRYHPPPLPTPEQAESRKKGEMLNELLVQTTNLSAAELRAMQAEGDRYLSVQEACDMGLVDGVVSSIGDLRRGATKRKRT